MFSFAHWSRHLTIALVAWLLAHSVVRAAEPVPRHDSPDQPFRRAPMAAAARSIIIPLATNLHLAFDTELFRTHTAWSGPGLNLFGAPFHDGTDHFLCDFTGPTLWSNPPVFPWWLGSPSKKGLREMPARQAFRGVSTKGGFTTLLYELTPTNEDPVRIHETPRLQQSGGINVVVRRFEIAPCPLDLEFLAHAEVGRFVELENTPAASALLEREQDVLLIAARGRPALTWKLTVAPTDYIVERNTERDGVTEVRTARVVRDEARAQLIVPAHSGDVAFEVVSAVCRNRAEALKLLGELIPALVKPANLELPASRETLSATNAALVLKPAAPAATAPVGDDYFRFEHISAPAQRDWRVTGMDWLPNGDLALCTLAGEVWIAQQAQGDAGAITWRRFARGLCEPGGLKVVAGVLHVAQKCELTRLVDTDADGEADLFECLSQGWGFLGSPTQFAFGPLADAERNLYVQLDGRSNDWDVSFRAWSVKINPAGEFEGFCRGLRSPGGFGAFGPEHDLFATDSAGAWVGAGKLLHLRADFFYGAPAASPASQADFKGGKAFALPAVWFPAALAKSVNGLVPLTDAGLGPFHGQVLVADPEAGSVLRVALEKVNGEWQGAVWPLITNLGAGVSQLAHGADGCVYAGATGTRALTRVRATGQVPFEVQEIHALPTGFELTFTQPVDAASAGRPASYAAEQFTYWQREADGSPEVIRSGQPASTSPLKITQAAVSADRRKVRLIIAGARPGYVTKLRGTDVKNAEGKRLWHDTLYYTLNAIPQ